MNETPLITAFETYRTPFCFYGDTLRVPKAEALIAAGADVNAKSVNDDTPLSAALLCNIDRDQKRQAAESLITAGAELRPQDIRDFEQHFNDPEDRFLKENLIQLARANDQIKVSTKLPGDLVKIVSDFRYPRPPGPTQPDQKSE